MSISIPLKNLSEGIKDKIDSELRIKIETKRFNWRPDYIYPYTLSNNHVHLPFNYALKKCEGVRPPRSNFSKIELKFEGELKEDQVRVKDEALKHLNSTGCVILSCYPGFGKTALGIYLSIVTKLSTLIIVPKTNLMLQWKESINRFCPKATIQILKGGKTKLEKGFDFYVIYAPNIEKMKGSFGHIGTVIGDEMHRLVTKTNSRGFLQLFPRYLIGLSATPIRKQDNLWILFSLYFGDNTIHRQVYRHHLVYTIKTGMIPETRCNDAGELIWDSVLSWQANCNERNEIGLKIISKFKKEGILILTKRKDQITNLMKKLEEMGESYDYLMEDKQIYDKNKRIIISNIQKAGEGTDFHSKISILILMADLDDYFLQYLGRILMRSEKTPMVFDLIDEQSSLLKHASSRENICKDAGGVIVDFYTLGLIEEPENVKKKREKKEAKANAKGKVDKDVVIKIQRKKIL